jgi:hypothetical protein
LLSFNAVVAAMQQAQVSQRLNGDQIAAWYDASKTGADNALRYGSKDAAGNVVCDDKAKAKSAALRSKYLSLASNNPAIMPELAVKMLAYINPEDASNLVCKALVRKLDSLSKVSVNAEDL